MTRMGHASAWAALIYQHATAERDRAIADALHELAKAARMEAESEGTDDASGADLARDA